MPEFVDYLPLFQRKEEDIRTDWDMRANAGLAPTDPDWVDTREGGMFYICTQGPLIECARLWDSFTEVAAASNMGTTWGDYLDLWASAFGLERNPAVAATGQVTFTGTNGTLIGSGTQVSPVQVNPDETPPVFETTASGTIAGGSVTLPVQAVTEGEIGNVAANAITLAISPLPGVTSLTNAAATAGGTDAESDISLRNRIQLQFSGRGAGTQADYERWALEYPSVGRVTVVPAWAGGGTVQVIVSTEQGDPVSTATIEGLQTQLDPIPGQGAGQAPIGHTVTVATVTPLTINIVATVTLEPGYALGGTGGLLDVRPDIEAAITAYINSLSPGEDVVYNHVRATFFESEGVRDVPSLTLNGTTGNVVVGTSPPEVARVGTITLS